LLRYILLTFKLFVFFSLLVSSRWQAAILSWSF
jgi:hypothetical protein